MYHTRYRNGLFCCNIIWTSEAKWGCYETYHRKWKCLSSWPRYQAKPCLCIGSSVNTAISNIKASLTQLFFENRKESHSFFVCSNLSISWYRNQMRKACNVKFWVSSHALTPHKKPFLNNLWVVWSFTSGLAKLVFLQIFMIMVF